VKGFWSYKGNLYNVVATAQSKNQQTRCWQTSIIYKDKTGALFVREEKEFKERFKRLDTLGLNYVETIFMDDPEINPPAPKGKLKEWYDEVIIDPNNKGQVIVTHTPALAEAIRKGHRITVSVEGRTK